MPSPVVWCRARYLVVFLPVAMLTGQAAGNRRETWPTTRPPPTAPAIAAKQTQTPPTSLETPIGKRSRSAAQRRQCPPRRMEAAPCRILVGDDADEILGRPAFPFIKSPVEPHFVVLSVFELGFSDGLRSAIFMPGRSRKDLNYVQRKLAGVAPQLP